MSIKKSLLLVIVLTGICAFGSPASAYVELVLAPPGYVYEPGAAEPEITVMPSEQFVLALSIATDETIEIGGLNTYLYFDPVIAKVKDILGSIVDYPSPVVDNSGTPIPWGSFLCLNDGDNILGTVTYDEQMGMDPYTLFPGQTHLGYLEFHCEICGIAEIYPGEESQLWPGTFPGNLFTSYHGVLVNALIPEPCTVLLMGTGLAALPGFIRRKKTNSKKG